MPHERTGFIAAFAGVCRGRAIFPRLLRQSLWRAIAHLLLTVLLCTVIGTALRYWDNRTALRRQQAHFEETFGELILHPRCDWWLPSRDPERPRTLTIPDRLKLIYAPAPAAVPPFPPGDAGETPVVVLFPRKEVVMEPVSEDKIAVFLFDLKGSFLESSTIPAAERNDFFARMPADPQPLPDPAAGDAARIDTAFLMRWIQCQFFFTSLLGQELSGLAIFLLLFLGVFTLTGGPRSRTMSYREILLTGIYVSLPVLPVACCFPVFDLPLLPFSTAYLLGVMGYFLFTVHFIERSRRSGGEVPPTEG